MLRHKKAKAKPEAFIHFGGWVDGDIIGGQQQSRGSQGCLALSLEAGEPAQPPQGDGGTVTFLADSTHAF